MFRVIIGNVTIANLPDRQTAVCFTERFRGVIQRIRYKSPLTALSVKKQTAQFKNLKKEVRK